MARKEKKKHISLFLCMMLIVAMAFTAVGCGIKDGDDAPQGTQEVDTVTFGEGQTTFQFTVTDKDGTESAFEIHTDAELVGEALSELGLIEGEESSYGLYVTKVNGITADYATDGTYWAFYIDGAYAMSGVDTTPVTEGAVYSFKVEK